MKIKILISVLVVINIMLISKVVQLSNSLNFDSIAKRNNYLNADFVNPALKAAYLTNGQKISNIKLKQLNGDSVSLNNFLGNSWKIVLVYSELSCNICVDSLIMNCNQLLNKLENKESIIGIAHSRSITYLNRFVRINQIKFPMLWDEQDKFSESNKLSRLPAILIVDPDKNIINSYYSNNKIDKISSSFFDAAYRILKKTNN